MLLDVLCVRQKEVHPLETERDPLHCCKITNWKSAGIQQWGGYPFMNRVALARGVVNSYFILSHPCPPFEVTTYRGGLSWK